MSLFTAPIQEVYSIRYTELASSIIILYDYIITLDAEIELIWKSGWSLGKCLFLLNRYYTLFVVGFNNYVLFSPNLTNKLCLYWIRWQGSTGIVAFILAELILQLRLYALYFLDKRVLALMAITFTAAVVTSTTLMAVSLTKITAVSNLIPGLPFCVPLGIPRKFYTFWIPILISETFMCSLALWRGLQSYFRRRTIYHSGRRLVEILLRDSFLYFLILFAVYLCSTIIFVTGTPSQLESVIGYSVAMSCVMSNRLCLNVRGMLQDSDELAQSGKPAPPLSQFRGGSILRSRSLRRPSMNIVVFGGTAEGAVLSEIEMDELRDMRVAYD